ncbi:glycosyltransferase [Saccharospirillum mangrovi]|uniref:glycosyltransferase n=1 Tax=Saccharospirillum mangrovi TaxID=2161747 RepID=UPI000D3A3A12|nr:glycosyltransferase [Saccharospirillum mangrovi]
MPRALIFRKELLPYTETFIAEQAHHLPNWEPVFIGFKRNSAGYRLIKDKAVSNKPYHISIESDYSTLPKITSGLHKKFGILNKRWLNNLSDFSPSIIHAHFGSNAMNCIPLSRALGIPLITTFHGNDITQNTPRNYYRKNRNLVFENSIKVIAVSNFIRDELLKKGCPEDKIIQHYIGINTNVFTPPETAPTKNKIVFVGRLVEKKGCEYLIQAMQQLAQKNSQVTLSIIGDGPLKEHLQKLAASKPCNVNFLGRMTPDQLALEVKMSQLLCAPSITATNGDQEGLPMSILEALASGVPVVSSYSAGISEAIDDGSNGYLTHERDVDTLAEKIQAICSNPDLRHQMSASARKTAQTRFDLDKQSTLLEEIYVNAISS